MNVSRLLWTGGVCLVTGWALSFLAVIDVLTPSFFLAFIAIAFVVVGMITGFFGVYTAFRTNKRS